MTKRKICIGIIIENNDMPAWLIAMINELSASNYCEIRHIVEFQKPPERHKSALKHLFYHLYLRFDKKKYRLSPNALEKHDLKNVVDRDVNILNAKRVNDSIKIDPTDIDMIKTLDIDVFLDLTSEKFGRELIDCARYGVWSYTYGNSRIIRGGPSGVWEFLKNSYSSGVSLQMLGKKNEDNKILYESFSSTDKFGIHRNLNNFLWKASSFVPRKLKRLHFLGPDKFFEKVEKENEIPYFYFNPNYGLPNNRQMLQGIWINYVGRLKKRIRDIFYFEQYIILYQFHKDEKFSKIFYDFKRIIPPKDRFWADPFIYRKDNRYYIFLEELIYKKGKGTIAVLELDEEGNQGQVQVVIEKNYHLSYPFLIHDENDLFMIPETKENRTIELYKCVDFPLKWELQKVLMSNIEAVDTTIFFHNNKYWLFANIKERPGISAYDELFLFFTDSLQDDDWTSHPQNPIVSDVNYARPAGNIFSLNNRIFRPSQNCSKHYGYGMQIREIITLNELEYEEKQVQSINPNWEKDLISTHTLNYSGRLTVIDALIRRKR